MILFPVFYRSSMPLGPFGEVVGTTGTLDAIGIDPNGYRSKVIAPRNPKLLKQGEDEGFKVSLVFFGCVPMEHFLWESNYKKGLKKCSSVF